MIVWSKIPFLRMLIPLLLGITLGLFSKIHPYIFWIFGLAILIFWISFFISNRLDKKYLKGICYMSTLMLLGLVLVTISKRHWMINYYNQKLTKSDLLIIKITEPLVEKRQSLKTFGEVKFIKSNEGIRKVNGKIVLYFAKCIKAKKLKYGDIVIIRNNIQQLKDAPNPFEFSPKDYLGYRAIYESCYLKESHWKKVNIKQTFDIVDNCYKAREYCLRVFKQNGLEGDEFAVASAMIVGFEDELKPEIISYFSASGAMHLLSVSGLHIAFVYIILSFMLKPLERFKKGKFVGFIICIFVLWFYAIVTGFSAPVVRSAIMFSMVVYAKSFNKYLNMFNVLGFAGFFILIFDPLSIADVGFQLSFLALLSILIIQPIISELYFSKNWVIQKSWEITSVSISATIGTIPLTFYYFHQFPNYFLLVNLLVIPLSTLLLYTGFAVIIFSWMPFVPYVLTQFLKYITITLNYLLKLDESLPGSVTTNIQFNEIETILLFISVVFLCIYMYLKHYRFIIYSGVSLIGFFICGFCFYIPHVSQKKLIIYSINKHLGIDYFDGNKTFFISDTALKNSIIDMRYHVFPNRIRNYIYRAHTIDLDGNHYSNSFVKHSEFLKCNTKTIAIAKENIYQLKHSKKINIDYLLIALNFKGNLKAIDSNYNYQKIVIDASLIKPVRKKLIKELKQNKIEYWDVLRDGALVINTE